MIYPSADKIDKEIESKYALVVLAAKRARQIKEGAPHLIQTDSANALTIALEEIAGGKIKYEFDESSLAGQEALEDLRAVVGARDIVTDGDSAANLDEPENLRAAKALLGADLSASGTLGDEDDEDAEEVEAEEEEDEAPPGTLDDEAEGPEA